MNSFVLNYIPPDIELPIPANIGLLEILIIVTFLLHIIFVNITISLASNAVLLETAGIIKKNKLLDDMAKSCSFHASVLKSIAVVLGVAPLLIVSVIYTQYFYTSTLLIGKAWMSIILLLIIAFLFMYAYKFTWDRWQNKKGLHLLLGLIGALILLFIPLIFIVNVVSMLYPDLWAGSQGFFQSLFYYPQIWQRYFHFILASLASGGLYLYIIYSYKKRKLESDLAEHEQALKLFGLKVGFWITLVQFISGVLLLFSFKKDIRMLYLGEDTLLTTLLVLSIILSVILCVFLYIAANRDSYKVFLLSVLTFLIILGVMGTMRHELRENYLQPYMDDHPRTFEQSSNS